MIAFEWRLEAYFWVCGVSLSVLLVCIPHQTSLVSSSYMRMWTFETMCLTLFTDLVGRCDDGALLSAAFTALWTRLVFELRLSGWNPQRIVTDSLIIKHDINVTDSSVRGHDIVCSIVFLSEQYTAWSYYRLCWVLAQTQDPMILFHLWIFVFKNSELVHFLWDYM